MDNQGIEVKRAFPGAFVAEGWALIEDEVEEVTIVWDQGWDSEPGVEVCLHGDLWPNDDVDQPDYERATSRFVGIGEAIAFVAEMIDVDCTTWVGR